MEMPAGFTRAVSLLPGTCIVRWAESTQRLNSRQIAKAQRRWVSREGAETRREEAQRVVSREGAEARREEARREEAQRVVSREGAETLREEARREGGSV